ncbi:MAG: aldehyde dehydrogenase family protein [Paracoccaceae bacterium]
MLLHRQARRTDTAHSPASGGTGARGRGAGRCPVGPARTGETTGQAIGRHPDIDIVSFTGSTEVGGYFLRYAGESNLKVIGLEMGGKSPFIVLDDADLNDDLIEHAAMSAFWNGGQNCSANMRQLVDAKLAEDFAERVIARARELWSAIRSTRILPSARW